MSLSNCDSTRCQGQKTQNNLSQSESLTNSDWHAGQTPLRTSKDDAWSDHTWFTGRSDVTVDSLPSSGWRLIHDGHQGPWETTKVKQGLQRQDVQCVVKPSFLWNWKRTFSAMLPSWWIQNHIFIVMASCEIWSSWLASCLDHYIDSLPSHIEVKLFVHCHVRDESLSFLCLPQSLKDVIPLMMMPQSDREGSKKLKGLYRPTQTPFFCKDSSQTSRWVIYIDLPVILFSSSFWACTTSRRSASLSSSPVESFIHAMRYLTLVVSVVKTACNDPRPPWLWLLSWSSWVNMMIEKWECMGSLHLTWSSLTHSLINITVLVFFGMIITGQGSLQTKSILCSLAICEV